MAKKVMDYEEKRAAEIRDAYEQQQALEEVERLQKEADRNVVEIDEAMPGRKSRI